MDARCAMRGQPGDVCRADWLAGGSLEGKRMATVRESEWQNATGLELLRREDLATDLVRRCQKRRRCVTEGREGFLGKASGGTA